MKLPELEVLKKRKIHIPKPYDDMENVHRDYDVWVTKKGQLMFVVRYLDLPFVESCDPCLYYGGGSRAIFVKNEDTVVVFDSLNPDVQKPLSSFKKALVAEVKFISDIESPAYEYKVNIQRKTDIDEIAGELIAWAKKH